jgi:nucleoside-diphosphate-sugar epimerase
MRIVVTGAAGFIGSRLCETLIDMNIDIVAIDNLCCGYINNISKDTLENKRFSFHNVSINDKSIKTLIKKDDIIIHLAAISSLASNQEDPTFSYNNNISGTLNILEISRIVGVKHFIFSSTSAIYENTTTFPLKETDTTSPNLIYSIGKKHCEELIKSYYEIYGLQYSILRFFNVYGPKQDSERTHPALVPYLIKCFSKNEVPLLHSNGEQKRDYVFIDDIISLFKKLIVHSPINDIINVSSGKVISVKEIVELIKNYYTTSNINPVYRDPVLLWEKATTLWEGELPFSKERMTQEVEKYTLGSIEKAQLLLGWKAETTMSDGLRICISDTFN